MMPEGVDNAQRVLLGPEVLKVKALRRGMTRIEGDEELLKAICQSKAYDEALVEAIEKLKGGAPRALRYGLEDWNTENGLILYQGKVYVPKDDELR